MKLLAVPLVLCLASFGGFASFGADLPVREVILFKHGVGFFGRSGELKPGDTVRLDFKASDMNDVLKSLTVEEKGGGKVTGLRYDSSEPLEKKLEQFPFEIGDHFSLSAVLDQMKGARLELKLGSETVNGQIVSGREVVPSEKDRSAKEQVILLLDSGDVRVIDLAAAASVRFLDPGMQKQFVDYLRVVAQARSKEKRSVYIDSTSNAARSVIAHYMIPMAVWKSSYRLLFTEAEPTIEGWAIVDNTTDEDWNGVTLALVSGRPISFISELYEPRYVQRQVAGLAEERAAAPVVYASAMKALNKAPTPAPLAKAEMPMNGRDVDQLVLAGSFRSTDGPHLVADSTVAVTTQGREVGKLFEYRFDNAVTVKKGESAMIPFLQTKLNSRKLLIYQQNQGENPRNAFEISNSTGKTLDGGPITVYDAGVYAGEALMETLKSGDKRLISYAVDQGTRVTPNIESGAANIRSVSAKRGILTTRSALVQTNVYTIRNVDNKPKTLIIEQPIRQGFKLLEPKATETTGNTYRFEVKLAAKAETSLSVKEEYVYDETTSVSSTTPDQLLQIIRGQPVSDAGKKKLEAIAASKRQMADLDSQIAAREADINDTTRDQDRLRQNIGSLNAVSGQQEQVQRYAKQLSDGEARLATLRDQQRDARKSKQTMERALAAQIDSLEF